MTIDPHRLSGTASGGTFSVNTHHLVGGVLRNILIKAATASTIFDVAIVDEDSYTIYERTSETGVTSEITKIPVRGIYTVTISNATVDETFTIKLMTEE